MGQMIIPGGSYPDALPGGRFVCSIPGKLLTHAGELDLPAGHTEMLFNCYAPDASAIASKAAWGGRCWVYRGGWTDTGLDSPGVNGHGFEPDGQLRVMIGAPGQDSQGLRYYDESVGPSGNMDIFGLTPGWATGSPTYSSSTPFAFERGVTRLAGWTQRGDITVGQGDVGGVVVQFQGKHYLLHGGDCQFVRFNRSGDYLAVAFNQPGQAVIYWFTVSDILSLPPYQEIITDPDPDEEEEDPVPVEDPAVQLIVDVTYEIDRRFPGLRQADLEEFTKKRAWLAHLEDERVGRKSTEPGSRISPNTLGIKHEDGTLTAVDCVRDGEGNEIRPVPLIYPHVSQHWIEPEPADLGGMEPPDDPGTRPSTDHDLLVQILNELLSLSRHLGAR